MQLIEAALAFAITMLALSLVVSSFVEIIHRIFSMREEGLKHVLRQMFDQVLEKHLTKEKRLELANQSRPADQPQIASAEEALKILRDAFVAQMSANRAPMGAAPKAAATNQAENAGSEQGSLGRWKNRLAHPWKSLAHFWEHSVRLWSGRDLAAMTPAEFMERLGSVEVGHAIAKANIDARKPAEDAGATAAEAAHVVLKDVAQKFEAFGKEASVYFEGRARLLSVVVAIALAFLAHVDAIDLFKTYLRDPNARAKVIEQSEAVTAQYKSAQETIAALEKLKPNPPAAAPEAQKPAEDVKKTDEEKKKEQEANKREEEKKIAETRALDQQIEVLRKDALATVANAKAAVKQFADLGVPLGWSPERVERAKMTRPWVWTCKDPNKIEGEGLEALWKNCDKNKWEKEPLVQVPTAPAVILYLFLGGLLVGLGAPFWYNAVVGLTNIRNNARGTASADAQTRAAVVAARASTTQPVTAVDAFRVSHAAQPPKVKEGNRNATPP